MKAGMKMARKMALGASMLMIGCGPYLYELKTYGDCRPPSLGDDSTLVYFKIIPTSHFGGIPGIYHKDINREPYRLEIKVQTSKASLEGAAVRIRSARIMFDDGGSFELLGKEDKRYPLMMLPVGYGLFECGLILELGPYLDKFEKDRKFRIAAEIQLPGHGGYDAIERRFESREESWRSTIFKVQSGA